MSLSYLLTDKPYYVISDNGTTEVANVPLLGTQISMLIFPLIPNAVKLELPNKPQVEFVHNHNLGNFSFLVKKSAAGFIVTIRPILSVSNKVDKAADLPETFDDFASSETEVSPVSNCVKVSYKSLPTLISPEPKIIEQEDVFPAINSQNFPAENFSTSSQFENSVDFISPQIVETKPDYQTENFTDLKPEIETVPIYDPEFSTSFSDTSAYEPPIRPQEFAAEYNPPLTQDLMHRQTYGQNQTVEQTFITPNLQSSVPVTVNENPPARKRMNALFYKMAEVGASDLHLSVSMPPMIRKDGKMNILETPEATLLPDAMKELLTSIMPAKNQEEFHRRHDTDFAYEIEGLARFRANIFMDRKGMGGVFRIIPTKILTAEQLGLSKAIMDLCNLSKGLVVVTGPTGSGKSTTLCAMVDSINKNREDHIITIEDPIEFTHENQKCLVNQREVHNHTDSFKDALRAALREDPDILLVGEMRDLETISIAIETAETGHLVFGTLHTTTAPSTVDRIIDQFPADRQQQIRVMLSESLKGVIAQTLLPKKGGGRVAALEVLIITPAISNLIREGKTFQIPSAMQTGKAIGMTMLNDAMFELVKKGLVEPREAYLKAVDKPNFEALLNRNGMKI
ncbi:MAG: type IV pilus twitching motility protein PilT [Pyrinomonadaceae bacterium]